MKRRDLTHSEHYARQKERWTYQSVRLDHEDVEALRALAKRDGVSVAEKIREFITWELENDYKGADHE